MKESLETLVKEISILVKQLYSNKDVKKKKFLSLTKQKTPETTWGPLNKHSKPWPFSSSVTIALSWRNKSCRVHQGYLARFFHTSLKLWCALQDEQKGKKKKKKRIWSKNSHSEGHFIKSDELKKNKITWRKAKYGQKLLPPHMDGPFTASNRKLLGLRMPSSRIC